VTVDFTDSVRVYLEDDGDGLKRYDGQVRQILLHPALSLPGNRGLGLGREFLSNGPEEAASTLAAELEEQLEEYVPELSLEEAKLEDASGAQDGRYMLELSFAARG